MDSMFNARENRIAKQGMVRDLSKISSVNPKELKFNPSKYKENAHKRINGLEHSNVPQRRSNNISSTPINSNLYEGIKNPIKPLNKIAINPNTKSSIKSMRQ